MATGRVNMDKAAGLRIARLWAYIGNRVWGCGFRIEFLGLVGVGPKLLELGLF